LAKTDFELWSNDIIRLIVWRRETSRQPQLNVCCSQRLSSAAALVSVCLSSRAFYQCALYSSTASYLRSCCLSRWLSQSVNIGMRNACWCLREVVDTGFYPPAAHHLPPAAARVARRLLYSTRGILDNLPSISLMKW